MTAPSARIPIYPYLPPPLRETGLARHSEDDDGFYLPLGLAMVVESARVDPEVGARFDFEAPLTCSIDELRCEIARRGPGVVLLSSYVWNVAANLEAAAAIKANEPRCVTVHGGPSTPKHELLGAEFLRANPQIDLAVRGEGERTIVALLARVSEHFHLPLDDRLASLARTRLAGVSLLGPAGEVVRGPDPARVTELDALPSPYLTGWFDRVIDARASRRPRAPLFMATVESNRGCPYQCTFCDWGSLTLQKLGAFDAARVAEELAWIGRRQIHAVFLADANFGILPRDLEIAERIAETRRAFGFPREVVASYAKNGSELLPRIFAAWQEADVAFEPTISLQSQDPATLRTIRRSNVKHEAYVRLGEIFRAMGLRSRVQLMMGLPGQTLASWKDDLQFAFARQESVQVFPTRLLPNAPMAEPTYVAEHHLRVDGAANVIESATFTEAEWHEMGRLTCAFLLAHNWSLFRYVLMFLQWDHGLRAIDVVHAHVEAVHARPDELPEAAALLGPLLAVPPAQLCAATVESFRGSYERGFGPLLDELARFVSRAFGVPRDAAFDAALAAQEAVLPRAGGASTRSIELGHDVRAFVREGCLAMRRGSPPSRRLAEHAKGALRVEDPRGRNVAFDPLRLRDVASGEPAWELASPLLDAIHAPD
jgi:hypothetical protein